MSVNVHLQYSQFRMKFKHYTIYIYRFSTTYIQRNCLYVNQLSSSVFLVRNEIQIKKKFSKEMCLCSHSQTGKNGIPVSSSSFRE